MRQLVLAAALMLTTACAQKNTIVRGSSSSGGARVAVSQCPSANPTDCHSIAYITDAGDTATADPSYQLGVYTTFVNGSGVALTCRLATSESECLTDTRAFLIEACQNEVDESPPIYARRYANPSSGTIKADYKGTILALSFSEIICQFNQSRIN